MVTNHRSSGVHDSSNPLGARLPFWVLALLMVSLLLLQQLIPPFTNSRLGSAVHNAAHAPWFLVVTLILWALIGKWRGLGYWQRLLLCAGLSCLLGMLLEALQLLNARQASWRDVGLNFLGTTAAVVCILAWRQWQRGRRGLTLALAISATVPLGLALTFTGVVDVLWRQYQRNAQLPDLVDVLDPGPQSPRLIRAEWRPVDRIPEASGLGDLPLAQISLRRDDQWSGIIFREPYPHWRRYTYLALDLYYNEPFNFEMAIRAETFRDRAEECTVIANISPGRNILRIPVAELLCQPDRDRSGVRNLVIYVDSRGGGRTFYLARLWLE